MSRAHVLRPLSSAIYRRLAGCAFLPLIQFLGVEHETARRIGKQLQPSRFAVEPGSPDGRIHLPFGRGRRRVCSGSSCVYRQVSQPALCSLLSRVFFSKIAILVYGGWLLDRAGWGISLMDRLVELEAKRVCVGGFWRYKSKRCRPPPADTPRVCYVCRCRYFAARCTGAPARVGAGISQPVSPGPRLASVV